MIKELVGIDHIVYQLDYVQQNLSGRKLNQNEQLELIADVKEFVQSVINFIEPIDNSFSFLEQNGIQYIEDDDAVNTEHYIEFAYFTDDNVISVNKHIFEDVFKKSDVLEVITMNRTEEMLIYHEIYHFIEKKHEKELKRLKKNGSAFLTKRRYRFLVSELAAMQFSFIMTGQKISPYILNILLILNVNPDLAKNNYNRIVELNGNYKGVL